MSKKASYLPEYRQQLDAAKQFVEQYDDFLVVSHIQPDGDAASSTAAMGWMLQQMGKSYTMINEGAMPNKFSYLWGSDHVVNGSIHKPDRTFQYVISVDCADVARIGQVSALFAEHVQLLNIDHHPTNDRFGTHHLIKHDAAATVQILYDLAVHLHMEPTLEFGTCIYTGLMTDTGGFRYANTTPKVMQIAADLLQIGVKGAELAEQVLERTTYAQIQLLRRSLSTLSFAHEQQVAWLYVTPEDIAQTGASNEDLDGLVNYPRNIEGVQVGILFKQRDVDTIKVSLRSAGRVDVARIAQSLGGGGHVRAAGCTIRGTLDEAIQRIVEEVGRAL